MTSKPLNSNSFQPVLMLHQPVPCSILSSSASYKAIHRS